ncbi:uroporphyrinogen-III synthase [Massilia sp. YIM B02769]|uniref:uroporphyrinogen-III synthase n=1 Tax=unclassified Massilia TaxID=2609279 RepID=UPI0025B6A2D5|nr:MULTISPECIES: uroporphyrinogen-III synthase [unclassified Massilia]MDN4060080.1 uroporphyrinogen-III synthase [Massilia sp. YIM B02769]
MPDKVVITRPRAQAEGLAQAVAALGRTPVLLPLLEIAPLADQSALRAVLAGLDNYALVAFVSPNAIDAALAHLQERLAAWPRQVALAVLGEGSRAALARHGLTEANATIVGPQDPTRSDSENLLHTLDLAALRGKRVLIVRGESGRELMAEGFRAAGAEVDVVPAYRRSVPALTPELAASLRGLLLEPNDWLLTSSEALRGLFDLLALADPSLVAKMQQQHVIVPHARIAETAAALGLAHVTLTGSGDERLLAALQSRT